MLGDSLESASTTNMPPWGGVGPLGSVVSNSSSQETRQGGGAGLGGFGTAATPGQGQAQEPAKSPNTT